MEETAYLFRKYTKWKVIYVIVFEFQDVNHVKIYIYIRFPCFINFDISLMKLGDLTLSQLCGLYSNKVTAQASFWNVPFEDKILISY